MGESKLRSCGFKKNNNKNPSARFPRAHSTKEVPMGIAIIPRRQREAPNRF